MVDANGTGSSVTSIGSECVKCSTLLPSLTISTSYHHFSLSSAGQNGTLCSVLQCISSVLYRNVCLHSEVYSENLSYIWNFDPF